MSEASTNRPPTFRSAVSQAESPAALAALLLEQREQLRAANQGAPQGARACRALTEACDLVVQRMLRLALPADPLVRDATRPKIAVVATGGYGRKELCPFSDIDVTFIVAEEEDKALDDTVRQMFLFLMEIFTQRVGLKVGYAYRTVADVAQLDHQTQTALLDLRVVTGSHGLAERFSKEVFRHIWPGAFVRQKVSERRNLIARHGWTVHLIEPHVREGAGGLRDLHLAEWLAAVSFPSTRGDVWRQLQRLGVVTRRDAQQVTGARDFLLMVRNWMHWESGRPADALVRERQEGLAVALGFQDDDRASCVERFMERYYEQAETVHRVAGFVTDRCYAERLSLSDELVAVGDELQLAYPWVQVASPGFMVEICQNYQEYGLAPGYELRRMIAQHIDSCRDLSSDPEAADDFTGLLRAPSPPELRSSTSRGEGRALGVRRPGVYDTLRLMADLGILQRLLPEFGEAHRRVPFDQVHRHSIGFHCLETVRSLERVRASDADDLEELRRVWGGVQSPEVLYLSGFLHDIGKLVPPPHVGGLHTGHAEAGAAFARGICERLHLDPPAAAMVEVLIRHHLLMSETAQLRDLTLDKTIRDFTQEIPTPELLSMLLLLTYADMEATGVLSPMKVRFLMDLYYRAEAQLLSEGDTGTAAVPADRERRFRSRLSRQLSAANLTPEQIQEHTEGMPVSYLLNTRPEQVALHIRMVEALRGNGPVVEFDNELGSEVTTVHLCTLEDPTPGLLSRIAGVLYAHEIRVHGAQVFTRQVDPPIALDTLWADYHGRAIPPFKRLEVEQDLVTTLRGEDPERVIARFRKHLPPAVPPRRIRIDNDLAEHHTVLEIEAEDQPALLYRITRALAALGWNIHSARISTRGDRVRDAFYVTTADGRKLEGRHAGLEEAFLAEFSR